MYSFRNPTRLAAVASFGTGQTSTPFDSRTGLPWTVTIGTPDPVSQVLAFTPQQLTNLWYNLKTGTLTTPLGTATYDATMQPQGGSTLSLPLLATPFIREYGSWPNWGNGNPQISAQYDDGMGNIATLTVQFDSGVGIVSGSPLTYNPATNFSMTDSSGNASGITGTGAQTGTLTVCGAQCPIFEAGGSGLPGDVTFEITTFWYP